jgi:hypothetical protein
VTVHNTKIFAYIMNQFGFILTRHVNSESTNRYWNHSVKLIRTLYPRAKIVIIDDNSNQEFVKADFNYKNVEFVKSEFPGRGELLPYYYYIRNKYFENAIILHDSVFIHKRINFEFLRGEKVMPLWIFEQDAENLDNTLSIARNLNYSYDIGKALRVKDMKTLVLEVPRAKWYGCFGCQAYINHGFLVRLEKTYGISSLVDTVKTRPDRCCLERILGCLFSRENPRVGINKGLFGSIFKHYRGFEYSFDDYIADLKQGKVAAYAVKVWTGR